MRYKASQEGNMPSSQQVVIGEYASLYSNQAAIRHFSKKFGVEMKVTSVHH